LLEGSDHFLLPSWYEGIPFALLEALAHGTPVLSSDAGGAPEVVHAGVEGLLHRRSDPSDLARVVAVLGELREEPAALPHPRWLRDPHR
jgi:glycosyltransferase involved in cell wall biosynthesis